jgi:Lon protease-like protein
MSEDISDLGDFAGIVPLFPLPNVVLFPHVMLPLHIFEPRYRQMTADALGGDRLIALALLKPGWESEYEAKPPLYPVACLGKIVAEQRLEDGRYNILLRGLSRVRIEHEALHDKLYRVAHVELLSDLAVPAKGAATLLREQLVRLAGRWFDQMGLLVEHREKLFQADVTVGTLGDILSFALPLAAEVKQELLEELAVEQRLERLLQYLEMNEPPKTAPAGDRSFPPEFSSN